MHFATISAGAPETAGSLWASANAEVADLLDNVPWESAWPVLLIAGLLFFAICSVALSTFSGDEDETEYWRRMAIAGRCLFSGAAVVVAIGWVGGRMTGLV